MNKSLPIPKVENPKSLGAAFKKAEGPSFFNPVIQPKLTINQPNDIYEQEAEAVADKVMRMPENVATDNLFFRPAVTPIQRKCAHCEEEEKKLQRKKYNNDVVPDPKAEDHINSLSDKTFLQPKLSINQPDDIYEQEADAVADKVMRMPETSPSLADSKPFFSPPTVNINRVNAEKAEPLKKENKEEETEEPLPEIQAKLSFNGLPPPPDENRENDTSLIQRKCAHCEEEEKKLQRKEMNSGETVADTSTENYISSLNGKGRSLTQQERNFFEPKIGYDFSNVQLHTNEEANQSAKSINALAYTHGNNIVFGSDQYQPETDKGKQLLAHELTHVVQQSGETNASIQRKPFGTNILFDQQDACPPRADMQESGYSDQEIALELYGNEAVIIDWFNNTTINIDYELLLDEWKPVFEDCVPQPEVTPPPQIPAEQMTCKADTEFTGETELSPGRITAKNGIRLHTTPDVNDCDYVGRVGISAKVYSYDSDITILASGNIGNAGWVKIQTFDDFQGWIEERFIKRVKKDSTRDAVTKSIYTVQKNDNLEEVIKNEYKDYPYTTGNDRRTIAHALYILNQGESTAFYFEGNGESFWKDLLDSDFEESRKIYATIRLKEGKTIRLPSRSYIDMLRDEGQVGVRPDWKNTAIEIGRSIEGFVEGVFYGFAKAIVDTVTGLIDFVKSIFTGELFEQAYEFYKQIRDKGLVVIWDLIKAFFVGIYNDFVDAWNNPNPYKKWFFFGEIIGMILFEIAIAYLTAGAGLARHIGKLGKILDAIPGLKKLATKAASKIDDLPSADAAKLGRVKAAEGKIENLGDMTGETRKMLRDPKNEKLLDSLNENPKAARALKKCASNCFPEFAAPEQIKEIDDLLVKIDTHFDDADYEGLKTYFHEAKTPDELQAKIDTLRSVSGKVIDEKTRGTSPLIDTLEKTERVRNSPGIANGGDSLRTINKVEDWIPDGDYRFLTFPKQIATKMKGQRFSSFKQFRETFWKHVADDPVLSQAFPSPANQSALRNGHAPFGKDGSKYELNHKHALEIIDQTYDEINTDLVYDFDNIEILTKKTHDLMKQ